MCYEAVGRVFVFRVGVQGADSCRDLGRGTVSGARICHVVEDDDAVSVVPCVVVSFVSGVRPVQYAMVFVAMRMQSSP